MKPHEPKKNMDKTRTKKKGGKQWVIKKLNQKGENAS
jgi:hypothetical protein